MTEKSVAQGSLIAILPQQGQLTKTAWSLPSAMTEADWKSAGQALSQVEGAMNWWLGDWWRFGEHKYGDRKALVESEEWTGPAFGSCMNAAAICAKFKTSRRREVVPFSHHAEVSSIPNELLIEYPGESWLSTKSDYPFQPRLQFRCSHECHIYHDMTVVEWGGFEWIRKNPDPNSAIKLFDNWRLSDANYEISLLLGNQCCHRNSFIVISVFQSKKAIGEMLRSVQFQAALAF